MDTRWIKRWLPRSLYGRAALILVLPVVTIQLVVSVLFIQRHFEGVTRQMSRTMVLDLAYLHDNIARAPDLAAAQKVAAAIGGPLGLVVDLPGGQAVAEARLPYDISGRTVAEELRQALPWVKAMDLASNTRRVFIGADSPHGPMQLSFERRRVSASNPHQLLVLMLGTSLLMTLVAYLFLRNQLRPILRLAEAAEAFGRGRVLPYAPSGATEVRRAGHAFLAMRARIERQIEQRTLMLSGVSHDLRTPLTRMRLALSMMDDTPDRALMETDIAEMEGLIAEFLSFARDDALDAPVEVDLAAFLDEVRAGALRAGRQVEVLPITWTAGEPADAMPRGRADAVERAGGAGARRVRLRPAAVGRALDNLIGNAARYGTLCRLTASVTPRAVHLCVEDNGPGIAAADLSRALKPFTTLDPARTRGGGSGAGLGLAIARDIARRHGGALHLGRSADLGGLKAELVLGL
jgi:two-component system osmolarity sensor histidine kinase EnvZ